MVQVNDIFRLGRDAEFKQVKDDGAGFIKLWLVASDKQKQGNEWIDVATWCSGALWRSNDKMIQYLQKGTQVFITGKMYNKEYEGKTYLTLDIRDLRLVGSRQEQQAPQQSTPVAPPAPTGNNSDLTGLPF